MGTKYVHGMLLAAVMLLPLMGIEAMAQDAAKKEPAQPQVESFSERYRHQERVNDAQEYMQMERGVVNDSGVVELKIGEAPSKEQLKKANVDMVWIKEEQVAGYTIQIPVVYIAEEGDKKEEKENE